VSPGTQHFENGSLRVESNSIWISWLKRYAKLVKELRHQSGCGRSAPYHSRRPPADRWLVNKMCRKYIITNNDLQNHLGSITVSGLIRHAPEWELYLEDDVRMITMHCLFFKEFLFCIYHSPISEILCRLTLALLVTE
jgi:hypothetical protein